MYRIIILVLLLTPEFLVGVEVPLQRESLTRRQRRVQRETIQIPLEGILLSPLPQGKVEEPLEREEVARKPTRWEKGESDLNRLIDRLRSLFRKELVQSQDVLVKIPEPSRIRLMREPSRIGSFRSKGIKKSPQKKKRLVQVLGLPEDHPSWLGPIPSGDRIWEKSHLVKEGSSVLRVRAWSRKDGGFRPFHVRVETVLEGEEEVLVDREGGKEGVVLTLPRHQIYRVVIWAGEPLIARTGYVSLIETHQDLIGEMLPWTVSSEWKPVALDVSEKSDGESFPGLASWKECLECMDLFFLGIGGSVHVPSQGNVQHREMSLEDLMGWCLTSSRERPILPWQVFGGQGGGELQVLGSFEPIPTPSSTPEGWLAFLQKAHRSGGVSYIKGLQKIEIHDEMSWSPLALMLFSGIQPKGVVLRDEGDWEIYHRLLSQGFRFSCLEFGGVSWSGQPFGGDHLLKFEVGSREVVKALGEGRVIVGSGVRVDFRLFDRPGGKALAEVGDRWVPPSGNQIYHLLPKLQFELDTQSKGLQGVELWINGKRAQVTSLNSPLKRGEALFSLVGLKEGDYILACLRLSDGRRVFTNPIFIGEDRPVRKEVRLVVHLPEGWEKGFLLLRKEGGVREISIEKGSPRVVETNLLSRLEIWSDAGEVKKTTPLHELFKAAREKNHHVMREEPLAQLADLEKLLPLKVDWKSEQSLTTKSLNEKP